MRVWAAAIAWSLLLSVLAIASARIGLRNLATFRAVRVAPPLDENDILAAVPPPRKAPRGWPAPDTIEDHRIAAAYRDYASDRADTRALQGELLVVVGGAALGTSIGGVLRGWWHSAAPGVAVLGRGVRRDDPALSRTEVDDDREPVRPPALGVESYARRGHPDKPPPVVPSRTALTRRVS